MSLLNHVKKRDWIKQIKRIASGCPSWSYFTVLSATSWSTSWKQLILFPVTQSAYRRRHSTECLAYGIFQTLHGSQPKTCFTFGPIGSKCSVWYCRLWYYVKVTHDSFIIRVPLAWLHGSQLIALKLWFSISPHPKQWHSAVVFLRGILLTCCCLCYITITIDVASVIQFHGLANHCYASDMQRQFSCKPEHVNTLVSVFIACIDELYA